MHNSKTKNLNDEKINNFTFTNYTSYIKCPG